jgi:hypothetical protein
MEVCVVLSKIRKALVDRVRICGPGFTLEKAFFNSFSVGDGIGFIELFILSLHISYQEMDAKICGRSILLRHALGRVLANECGLPVFDCCLDDDVMGLDGALDLVIHGYHPRPRGKAI